MQLCISIVWIHVVIIVIHVDSNYVDSISKREVGHLDDASQEY